MKIPMILFFLIPFTLHAQIFPSSCNIENDPILPQLENSAEYIAHNYVYDIQDNYIDSINLSEEYIDTFLNALIAVYNTSPDLTIIDTIFNHYQIEPFPFVFLNQIFLSVDSTSNWLTELEEGNIPTGYNEIDELIEKYGMTLIQYYGHPNLPYRLITLETSDNYNSSKLLELFSNLDGVINSDLGYSVGEGNHITGTLIDDKVNLVFSRGWGDCPSGCWYRQYWEFNVYSDCSVEYVGDYGNYSMNTENHIKNNTKFYPNPFTDKLYIESNAAGNYELYDLNGKIISAGIIENKLRTLNLNEFNKGIYILKLIYKNHTESILIMKQ